MAPARQSPNKFEFCMRTLGGAWFDSVRRGVWYRSPPHNTGRVSVSMDLDIGQGEGWRYCNRGESSVKVCVNLDRQLEKKGMSLSSGRVRPSLKMLRSGGVGLRVGYAKIKNNSPAQRQPRRWGCCCCCPPAAQVTMEHAQKDVRNRLLHQCLFRSFGYIITPLFAYPADAAEPLWNR